MEFYTGKKQKMNATPSGLIPNDFQTKVDLKVKCVFSFDF